MSRHSRTSPASSVLKLCKEIDRRLDTKDMDTLRNWINDYPEVSEKDRCTISDLVTIVVLKHEIYRKAFDELEKFLDSLES